MLCTRYLYCNAGFGYHTPLTLRCGAGPTHPLYQKNRYTVTEFWEMVLHEDFTPGLGPLQKPLQNRYGDRYIQAGPGNCGGKKVLIFTGVNGGGRGSRAAEQEAEKSDGRKMGVKNNGGLGAEISIAGASANDTSVDTEEEFSTTDEQVSRDGEKKLDEIIQRQNQDDTGCATHNLTHGLMDSRWNTGERI
jgi:hypothetical protein